MLVCNHTLFRRVIPKSTILFSLSSSISFFISRSLAIATLVFFSLGAFAQSGNTQQEAEYKKVLTERSAKIVNTIGLTDSTKYYKVVNELVNQYKQVNVIHDQNKTSIADIKKQTLSDSEKTDAIKKQEEKKSSELLQLHTRFIAHLKENLTNDQIEKVKDGMTYGVFSLTYAAFQDMIPNLTAVQKDKIYNWLKEARELAMDEGSSDDKHKVFGKYKGRINNYLSAEGYDMKKEGEAWQQRIKEKKSLSSNPVN